MSELLDILTAARKRYAENPSHAGVGDYPEPGTVCAVTAFAPVQESAWAGIDALQDIVPSSSGLVRWNAEHTTEEVLALFDRAILIEQLREAKRIYAAAPSHVPFKAHPEPGTHCPITACYRAEGYGKYATIKALHAAAGLEVKQVGSYGASYERLMTWNAEHTTEEVLALFDRAIQQAEHG